jgi:hypothetical protein
LIKLHLTERRCTNPISTFRNRLSEIIYLVKLALERDKEIEAQKALGGKPLNEKPKELLK